MVRLKYLVSLTVLLLPFEGIVADVSDISGYVFPIISPRVSSKYGKRAHPIYKVTRHHRGIDLAVPELTPVRVIKKGIVVFADAYAGFGNLITVNHGDGMISLYGHLSEILVNTGQKVTTGQNIGRVGSTGVSTGPHLHFEIRMNGSTIDPLKIFPDIDSPASG